VLFVAGNHEYYRNALPALTAQLRASAAGSAVHVLESDEVVLDGVCFLGCTLWSDFMAAGKQELDGSMAVCARLLNDYEVITWSDEERPLQPADTRALHLASREWLAEGWPLRATGRRLSSPTTRHWCVCTRRRPRTGR
jgi:hypothetical protein